MCLCLSPNLSLASRCIWWKKQPRDCAIAPGRSCGRRREGSRPDAERGRLGVDLGGRIGPEPRGRDGLEDRWCLYFETEKKGGNARQSRAVNAHVSRVADSESEKEMAMGIEKQKERQREKKRVRAGKLPKVREERAQGARSNEREKRRARKGEEKTAGCAPGNAATAAAAKRQLSFGRCKIKTMQDWLGDEKVLDGKKTPLVEF